MKKKIETPQLKQIETNKSIRKPYTGKSRSTQWRKEKKKQIETQKAEEKIMLKQEKTTALVALGVDKEQARAISEEVVEYKMENTEKLIVEAIQAKKLAQKKLDEMIIKNKIKPVEPTDWALMRKAIE